MKSSAPWSVKGIERDAREVAKEAARREGMTVGEWLNQVIVTAGDPATPHGEIEGLKLADLVTAIEHLNRRVISAETKGVESFDAFARNFGGVIERLQRLERIKPGEDGAPTDIDARLSRLEERATDRERIDALKALEKAIGQIAVQFDAAQNSQARRLDSTERQLQEMASRIDAAIDAGADASGIGVLKDSIDGLIARIAATERLAAEARRPGPAAGEPFDGEFVERTGARLRVLGDEIKRGGDQIRTVESSIRKLSEQIDAAERRSSEGVQKVAETISELRQQLAQAEAADAPVARQEVEAAVAELSQRTDDRILGMQRSFERMIARLDGAASAPALKTPTEPEPQSGSVDDVFDLDADFGAALADEADDEAQSADDAFEFEDRADKAAASGKDDATRLLRDVEDAFAGRAAPAPSEVEEEIDGIDAILAELDNLASPAAEPTQEQVRPIETDPIFGSGEQDAGAPPEKANYLQEARRAARQAAEKAAAEGDQSRRKLTPKQRAILAAKIRRKRLAEQGLLVEEKPPAQGGAQDAPDLGFVAPEAPPKTRKDARSYLLAGVAGAVGALRARLPVGKEQGGAAAGSTNAKSPAHADFDENGNPNLARRAMSLAASMKTRPVTLALGAAVVLAGVALFFLVKDLVFGGATKPAQAPVLEPAAAQPADAEQPQLKESVVPAPPGLTQPRQLYLDAVGKLRSATTEADTRSALGALEQAAALGHPPAQLQLGELYKLGQGLPQDQAQARAWFERAANGGSVLAMHRVGVMAARGQGGVADQNAAMTSFEKAASLGLVDSQYNLGAIYHPGGGATAAATDATKAYYWYSLASRNGDQQAGALAAGLAASLSPQQRAAIDASVAAFKAATPDPDANENAAAS